MLFLGPKALFGVQKHEFEVRKRDFESENMIFEPENVILRPKRQIFIDFLKIAFFSGGLGLQTYRKTCHETYSVTSDFNQTLHALKYDKKN